MYMNPSEAQFLNYIDSVKDNTDKHDLATAFLYHYRTNPTLYLMFERFAFEAIKANKKKLSAWLICNRMRWENYIAEQATDDFKISNDFIGLYARLFMARHPQHDGCFTVKQMKRIRGL